MGQAHWLFQIGDTGQTIQGILDSGSKIVAMSKWVWKELGLPICLDHTMRISSANASVDTMIGVLKNLMLDFSAGEVMVQVQVLACANFNLLLGHPFHCLMSTTIEDFLDGSQLITLCDPNSGKQITLPICPWLEGCSHF